MLNLTTIPGVPFPVSRIVLGTAQFGSAVPLDRAWDLLDRYAAAGGNHLDTAHIYAAWLPGGAGASERAIGAWLRRRGLAGRVLVASKCCHHRIDGPRAELPRVRPECIAVDLRESLDRLGLPALGLLYLHRDDPAVPADELVAALERERRAGLIAAWGLSNWTAARVDAACRAAARLGAPRPAANQVRWSLARGLPEGIAGLIEADARLCAWHRDRGLPIAAYSPQADGFFARSWDRPPAEAMARYRHLLTPGNLARWHHLACRAAAAGITPSRLALAWLLNQPQEVWPVVGCRTAGQLADSLAADAIRLAPGAVAAAAETDIPA